MRRVFVDSSFHIAFTYPNDEYHALAVELSDGLARGSIGYLTSHAVILEVLAFFSRLGPRLRERAVLLARRLTTSAAVEVVPLDDATLTASLEFYGDRLDKRYSLADCLAMVICRERGVTEILSTDRDFEAEGFTILLKR